MVVNKLLFLIILLLVILSAAFFWFLDADINEEIEDVEITSAESEKPDEVSRYSVPNREEITSRKDAARLAHTLPTFSFANDSQLTEENSTVVEVIDDRTEEPVPNAIVTILPKREYDSLEGWARTREDAFAFFSKHGTHFQTDDRGRVRIPDLTQDPMVAAMTANRISFGRYLAPMRMFLQVRLHSSIDVVARVVDGRGQPLPEAKVQLIVRFAGGRNHGESWIRPLFSGITNKEGLARIRIPNYLLRTALKHRHNPKLSIGVSGFLNPANTVAFDMDKPPEDIVELKIPDFAGLEIAILNEDGSRCERALTVILSNHEEGEGANYYGTQRAMTSRETSTGLVHWPRLPCGSRYNVTVRPESARNEAVTQVLEGPKTPGSLVRHTIKLDLAVPIMRGELRRPNGEALKNQPLYLKVNIRRKPSGNKFGAIEIMSYESYATKTDERGRFQVDLRSGWSARRALGKHLIIKTVGPVKTPVFFKVIPLGSISDGDVDLGIITLDREEVLIDGRVVDVHGDPIYRVGFWGTFTKATGNAAPGFFATDIHRIRTGRDGNFVIHGSLGSVTLNLNASAEGFKRTSFLVKEPSSGLVVTLSRPASLQGEIIFSNGLSTAGVVTRLLAVGGGEASPIVVKVNKKGSFVAKNLTPGNYRLTVTPHKSRSNLLLDMPLSLSDGQDLDLGDIRVEFDGARLDLVTVEPAKIKRGMLISVCEPGTTKEVTRFVLTKRKETLFIPIPVCDLHLTTAGYRQTVMKRVTSGLVELRMDPGIPVAFQFANPDVLPKGYEVNFYVDPNLGTGPFWLKNIGPGHTEPFHSPGRFRMSAQVAFLGNRRKTLSIPVSPLFITVADKVDPQLFELSLSEDDVNDVIRRLKP